MDIIYDGGKTGRSDLRMVQIYNLMFFWSLKVNRLAFGGKEVLGLLRDPWNISGAQGILLSARRHLKCPWDHSLTQGFALFTLSSFFCLRFRILQMLNREKYLWFPEKVRFFRSLSKRINEETENRTPPSLLISPSWKSNFFLSAHQSENNSNICSSPTSNNYYWKETHHMSGIRMNLEIYQSLITETDFSGLS